METKQKTIRERGEKLFSERLPFMSLLQEIADNFYPERADFTNVRNVGDDVASHLMTSYPAIARRDLGNAFGSMLRPTAKPWAHATTNRPDRHDTEAKQWLGWASGLMRNAMYDRVAQFTRATKEGDHDYAAFGQCVVSTEFNDRTNALLYRSWHIRDVAWVEDETGQVSTVYRKWKPMVCDLDKLFKGKLHKDMVKLLEKKPYDKVDVMHVVMPYEEYMGLPGAEKFQQPYVSIYIDTKHDHIIEEKGVWTKIYTVPRWQTISGSQYAYSPATIIALGDARLIQSVTSVLLEAGEKATNPPMLATQEAIRGDVAIYAGGITWVDSDYDERLGEVLRPMTQNYSALGFGMEVNGDIRAQIADAFYLNKLSLPPTGGPDMTAYEVGQRVQEYIRNALPLFEPMEMDYNGQICEETFTTLFRRGAFGDPRNIPQAIQGADIHFSFESPLHEAAEKMKVGQFLEAQQVIGSAVQLDPTVAYVVNTRKAAREAVESVAPAEWMNSPEEVDAQVAEAQAAAQTKMMMDEAQQGAEIVKTMSDSQA